MTNAMVETAQSIGITVEGWTSHEAPARSRGPKTAGPRYSIVTTLAVSAPILKANIESYRLGNHLGRVRASGVEVLALETDPGVAAPKVMAEIDRAVAEDDVNIVVLDCAGMVGIPALYGHSDHVQLIDGVTAACQLAVILSE